MSATRYCGYCGNKIKWQISKKLAACPYCKKEFDYEKKCTVCLAYVIANRPYCTVCSHKRTKLFSEERKAMAEQQKKENRKKLIAEGLLPSISNPPKEEYGVAESSTSRGIATPDVSCGVATPSTTSGVATPNTTLYSSLAGFYDNTEEEAACNELIASGLLSQFMNNEELPTHRTDTSDNEAKETPRVSTRRRVYKRRIKKRK